MDLSVIIVSWNVKEKLKANLQALFQSESDFKFEVIVVDNASSDGSAKMIAMEFSQVKLIANSLNLGFAKANNQAIKLAEGTNFLLLNPDMRVQSDTLQSMMTWTQNNPQAIVSGCRLVDEEGKIIKQVRRFPALKDQLLIVSKLPHVFPGLLDNYLLPNFDYGQAKRVDSVRGAFFWINVSSFKKLSPEERPLLDERYFIWFEEVDFCRQIQHLGGEVWYTPAATCLDYVGQSFKQVKRGQTQKYFRDSMLTYFKKWGKNHEVKILSVAWKLLGLVIR